MREDGRTLHRVALSARDRPCQDRGPSPSAATATATAAPLPTARRRAASGVLTTSLQLACGSLQQSRRRDQLAQSLRGHPLTRGMHESVVEAIGVSAQGLAVLQLQLLPGLGAIPLALCTLAPSVDLWRWRATSSPTVYGMSTVTVGRR